MGRRSYKRRHTRRQRGGDGYGYASTAFTASGNVPIESRTSYNHCDSGARVAPAAISPTLWGGRRRSRRQRGGACGCMATPPLMTGGGAGTGGYSLTFDNTLGKTYSGIDKAACPQAGGASIYENVAYPASYGYDTGSVFLSDSAHFLVPQADVSRCASGGRRKTRRSKKHRRHGRK